MAKSEPALTWAMVVQEAEERLEGYLGPGADTAVNLAIQHREVSAWHTRVREASRPLYARLREQVNATIRLSETISTSSDPYEATLIRLGEGPLRAVRKILDDAAAQVEAAEASSWDRWFEAVDPGYPTMQPLEHASLRVIARLEEPFTDAELANAETPERVLTILAKRVSAARSRRRRRRPPD